MPGYSTDGKVGAARVSQVDATPQHTLGETTIINGNQVAIYVYAGQTVSGSADLALNAGFTASASAGGFVALLSAAIQANAGTYIWARASAPITLMTAT